MNTSKNKRRSLIITAVIVTLIGISFVVFSMTQKDNPLTGSRLFVDPKSPANIRLAEGNIPDDIVRGVHVM